MNTQQYWHAACTEFTWPQVCHDTLIPFRSWSGALVITVAPAWTPRSVWIHRTPLHRVKAAKSQGTFNIWIGPTGNKRSWWGLDPQWVGVVGAWQHGPKTGGDYHLRCTFHRSPNVDMVAFSGSSVNLTTPKHKTIVRKQRTTLRIPSTLSDSTGCRSIG